MDLENLNRDIGRRVRARREELGLTTRELSEIVRIWTPTMYHSRITDLEEGRRDVRAREVVALAWALKVPVLWLLGISENT